MDKGTVLDYPDLAAENVCCTGRNSAFREWAFRPGPIFTYLKMLTFRCIDDAFGLKCRIAAFELAIEAGNSIFTLTLNGSPG